MQEATMAQIRGFCGEPIKVHYRQIQLDRPFMEVAALFCHEPGTVALMSGGQLDCARHHILGIRPWLVLRARGEKIRLSRDGENLEVTADPFETLRCVLKECELPANGFQVPVSAGLMGYFSYDLKDVIEKLPRTSVDTLGLPHLLLYSPTAIITHDKTKSVTAMCMLQRAGVSDRSVEENMKALEDRILHETPSCDQDHAGDPEGFSSNFEKHEYLKAIEKIIEYIKAGDVYQVNMSQRFEMGFGGGAFSLFSDLYTKNPAPFFAYIHAGDHHIVSTSPERFLLLDNNRVETRPIKGTRPRRGDPAEDKQMAQELLLSSKDDAELSMIVDLLRNDIGKVCRPGSVRVAEHKRLEAYRNVYHLISIVEGTLDRGCDAVDLIREAFPGGSITGCPKIRSMEIIDELEPCRRHVYTGSIGYVSFHGSLDLNIAIRTATISNRKIYVNVGGGIVFDSKPEDEFDETLHKGRTLMNALAGNGRTPKPESWVWINGTIKPMKRAMVAIIDEGLQYGFGIFETIRVVDGEARFLDEHLKRFRGVWHALFPDPFPDLTWDRIIAQVIEANGLEDQIAAVKILATRGHGDHPRENRTIYVSARPYIHRLEAKNAIGLVLKTYPEPRQSPLADHKTCNYLYYLKAGRWAEKHGAHEAIICNPDGSVSETNTANIIIVSNKTAVAPKSEHVLPGIMQEAVCSLLSQWGFSLSREKITIADMTQAGQVILTNSLMGAVPVLEIDGKSLRDTSDAIGLCEKLNREIP